MRTCKHPTPVHATGGIDGVPEHIVDETGGANHPGHHFAAVYAWDTTRVRACICVGSGEQLRVDIMCC